MKDNKLEQKLERARQLLAEIHHVPIATVNADVKIKPEDLLW